MEPDGVQDRALGGQGARAVERITDLRGCDVVFVMVATPADLEEVVCGEHGLLGRR